MLFGEIGFVIAERAGLGGAAGSVILRIEVEDDVLPLVLLQRHLFAARRGKSEVGSLVADLWFVEILHRSSGN